MNRLLFKTTAFSLLLPAVLAEETVTWSNSGEDNQWATSANWSSGLEPSSADIALFPADRAGTITLTNGRTSSALHFANNYLLSGGSLGLGGGVSVSEGALSTIDTPLTLSGPLVKTGAGTLVLGGANTNPFGTSVAAGILRARKSTALGATSCLTTIHSGATLEISTPGSYLEREIKLMDGSSITSSGNGTTISKITVDAGANHVHLGAPLANEVLSLGLGDDDNLIGGNPSTIIDVDMTGVVKLAGKSTLPVGSSIVATGGGSLDISFALAGNGLPIEALVSPVGQAGISMHNGTLRLQMRDLIVNPTTDIHSFSSPLTLSGTVTISPEKAEFQAWGGKTIQVPNITLAPDSTLKVAGAASYKIGSRDPLIIQGNATLSGSEASSTTSVLGVPAGIQGSPTTALTVTTPAAKPFTLDIGASSTYGGGTTVLNGTVNLRAMNSLGTGPLVMSGGTIRVHTPGAFNGSVNIPGGSLQAETLDAFVSNPVTLDGGSIIFRSKVNGVVQIPSLTVGSTGYIRLSNAELGSPQITLPEVRTNSTASISVESFGAYGTVSNFQLGGDLSLTVIGNNGLRSNGITFDIPSRKFAKTGSGPLTLTGASNYSGGTEILNGLLIMNHAGAIGSGPLTMGGDASLAGATLTVGSGLTYPLPGSATFNASSAPKPASITGNLSLGSLAHDLVVGDSSNAGIDLSINSEFSGDALSSLRKLGPGTLALYGNASSWSGSTVVEHGILELNKPGNPALGTGSLTIDGKGGGTTRVRVLQSHQIPDFSEVRLDSGNEVFLELNNNTEGVGPLTIAQSDAFDYSAVKTGGTGKLVLNGKLTLQNNTDSPFTQSRNVLITGNGGEVTQDSTGVLDLGGGQRTIEVTTTTTGTNATKANATIETSIVNGGIVKTGARTLYLTNANNSFSGGLQISGGNVVPSFPGSLGSGPIRIAPGGESAGLDLAKLGNGSNGQNYTIAGSGEALLLYSAPAPQKLSLTGGIKLEGNSLTVEVSEGTRDPAASATLEINGEIEETGEAAAGLVKRGNGVLKLAAVNTFTGESFIQKGTLSIPSATALGVDSATLHFDGGNLLTNTSFTMARGLHFTFAGGTISPASSTILELTGPVVWSTSASSFAGSGTAIISGASTGTGALWLGRQLNFAPAGSPPQGQVLSLRGSASLPTGNLLMDQGAVLELGNGDFTRPLGGGAGQVQLPTRAGAGWSAFGADRVVNLGGSGQPLVWGNNYFLYENIPGTGWVTGPLILGSGSATHTVDFQNDLILGPNSNDNIYRLLVKNGPAGMDARISGDLQKGSTSTSPTLTIESEGNLELTGDLSGIALVKSKAGEVSLKGSTQNFTSLQVLDGKLQLYPANHPADDAQFSVADGGILDASFLEGTSSPQPFRSGSLGGTYDGELANIRDLVAGGTLTGSLSMTSGGSLSLTAGKTFAVGGNLGLPSSGTLHLTVNGSTPDQISRIRVNGAVHLAGSIQTGIVTNLVPGDSFTFLLNEGDDPIQGIFENLPEGGTIPIHGGMALKISYHANGDGGAIANDVGFTVVEGGIFPDLALTGTLAHEIVAPGAPLTLTYRALNKGASTIAEGQVQVTIPADASYVGSTPSIIPAGTVLNFSMTALAPGEEREVSIHLTAPGSSGAFSIDAAWDSGAPDTNPYNNSVRKTLVVTPGGTLAVSNFERDPTDGATTLAIATIQGAKYRLQFSADLLEWHTLKEFTGDGEVISKEILAPEAKGFLRFTVEAAE